MPIFLPLIGDLTYDISDPGMILTYFLDNIHI